MFVPHRFHSERVREAFFAGFPFVIDTAIPHDDSFELELLFDHGQNVHAFGDWTLMMNPETKIDGVNQRITFRLFFKTATDLLMARLLLSAA